MPSFTILDQRQSSNSMPSFFLNLHAKLFGDLIQRLRIDSMIIDYNYTRLLKCMSILTEERLRYRFGNSSLISLEQLSMDEYPMALEFYLQFDGKKKKISID